MWKMTPLRGTMHQLLLCVVLGVCDCGQATQAFALCPSWMLTVSGPRQRQDVKPFKCVHILATLPLTCAYFWLLGSYKHWCKKNLRMLKNVKTESMRILFLKHGHYMKNRSQGAGLRIFSKETPSNYMWQRPFGVFHTLISVWYFEKNKTNHLTRNLFPCAFSYLFSPPLRKVHSVS